MLGISNWIGYELVMSQKMTLTLLLFDYVLYSKCPPPIYNSHFLQIPLYFKIVLRMGYYPT